MSTFLFALLAAALVGLWPASVAAAIVYNPFEMVLVPERDGKPNQQVVKYVVKPDAARYLVDGGQYIDISAFENLREVARANNLNQLRALALEEGWGWYSLSAGWTGATGTFAEHAMEFTSLSNANNALTNIGGVLTVLQVGIDLAKGDNRQAGIDAYKGVAGFAIGKFGSSALQIGGIAFFIFDQTLTTFGNTAWAEREKAWRYVYQRYYAEKEADYSGTVTQQRDLVDRFRSIRARRDGGRSLNDWKVIATFYFENSKTPEKFQQYLNADIASYVAKFWISPDFDEYSADGGWSTAGFARSTSLTQKIMDNIEKEHADAIRAMLIKKVLPEVQRRAVQQALEAAAKKLNGDWRKSENETVTVEVSAYDIKEPTRFELILPKGGSWSGTIAPGKPRKLKITKIAMTLAGFPDTIALDGPNGREEQTFKLVDDAAIVVFGTPDSPVVTSMSRKESDLSCIVKIIGEKDTVVDLDGEAVGQAETRPAPPSTPIHMGVSADGTLVMGQYVAESGWQIASPGAYSKAGLSFGAPYFENIKSLSGCGITNKDYDFFGAFANQACTVIREFEDTGPNGEVREVHCTSQMTLTLKGGFAPINGVMTYTELDPKFFEQQQKSFENSTTQMQNLPGGG